MRSSDDVKREIARLYDKDPRKWRILSGRDGHGYHDLVVTHGAEVWVIKEQLINPYKSVGFAVKTLSKVDPFENSESPQCGIRPVSQRQIGEIVETIQSGKSAHELLSEIINQRPVSFREVRSPVIVQGPILRVDRPADVVSTKQRDLDVRLKVELDRLLMKKYRQTVVPYI